MSKTPNYDAKVKQILDNLEPGERTCSITDEKWMMDEDEINWYKKFNVPPSRLSPFARWKQRTASYTGYQFWYNKDCETGKTLITHFHPASYWKIMDDKEWFQKDFSSENLEFDLSSPFFDKVEELIKKVPVNAFRNIEEPVNSIGTISLGDVDSYFALATQSQRCYYSADSTKIEDSMEVFVSRQVDRSYNVLHSYNISDSKVVRESRQCMKCFFIFDCRNCESCFFSWNHRNKKYLWFNEQLTKDEWERRFSEIDLTKRSVYEEWLRKFKDALRKEAVWPENFNFHCENSSGEYLTNCTNCDTVFFGEESTDSSWSCYLKDSRDCFHADAPWCSGCYLCGVGARCEGCKFCWVCFRCQRCEYCINCYECENCFGCVGLNRKKFCIFNKQYSEEEYWQKLDEIKCAMLDRGEYGQGFPVKFSNGYTPESGMGWMFSLTKEEITPFEPLAFEPGDAGAFGPLAQRVSEAKTQDEVPDALEDLDDSWVGTPIFDADYKRPFAYQKHEIAYCKKYGIAPYTTHFLSRFWSAQKEMNLILPVDAQCGACSKALTVSKNLTYPDRKIYCMECYLKHLEING